MLQILQRIIAVILSSFSVFSTFIGSLSFEEYDVFKNLAYVNNVRQENCAQNPKTVLRP